MAASQRLRCRWGKEEKKGGGRDKTLLSFRAPQPRNRPRESRNLFYCLTLEFKPSWGGKGEERGRRIHLIISQPKRRKKDGLCSFRKKEKDRSALDGTEREGIGGKKKRGLLSFALNIS